MVEISAKIEGGLKEKRGGSAQVTAFQGIGRNSRFSFHSVIA
jgi:hypothetical protein